MMPRSLSAAGFKEVAYNDDRLHKRKHRYQRRDSDFWGLPIAIEHPRTEILMVLIPGGEFNYGARVSGAPWSKVSRMKLDPYYLSINPITQGLWTAQMRANPSRFKGENRPVESVTKDDISRFLALAGSGLRLPTNVEWERAARGGTRNRYWWADEYMPGYANCLDSGVGGIDRRRTTDVRRFERNPFGLRDMVGNVWEWVAGRRWLCLEEYVAFGKALGGTSVSWGAIRGGSWRDPPSFLRCSEQLKWPGGYARSFVGFRVARDAV